MNPHWKECLHDRYEWLANTQDDLVGIAHKIISIIEDENGTMSVHGSSVWAVCAAYLMHRGHEGFALSDADLHYTRSRGGVIGCRVIEGEVVLATIRGFLEERDAGFAKFMAA